jgi:hypothetical protein
VKFPKNAFIDAATTLIVKNVAKQKADIVKRVLIEYRTTDKAKAVI